MFLVPEEAMRRLFWWFPHGSKYLLIPWLNASHGSQGAKEGASGSALSVLQRVSHVQ